MSDEQTGYPCDGCGSPTSSETLWLAAPIGLTAVHVCRDRDCAEAARERRGGGRFIPRPRTKDERAAEALA